MTTGKQLALSPPNYQVAVVKDATADYSDEMKARALFSAEARRRPRGRYTIRQRSRVLDEWPARPS